MPAAAATGLGLAAAFPAPDLGPLALVALVPLLTLLGAARPRARHAAWLGYLAGLLFFGLHMSWVAQLGADRAAGRLAWAALTLLEATSLAVFFAAAAAGGPWQTRWKPGRALRVAGLAGLWVGLELLRAHVPFGGNAWGLLGVTQHDGGPLLGLARVIGVYGLSAVLVAINLTLTMTLLALLARTGWRQATGWAAAALALMLVGLAAPGLPPARGAPVTLAVVQGNATFTADNRGQTNQAVFGRHVTATHRLADQPTPPDLVVWGEGAADDDPLTHAGRHSAIRAASQAAGAPVLLGATTELADGRYHTEALLFGPRGRDRPRSDTDAGQPGGWGLLDRYVKRRLLPFGEFIPLSGLLRTLVPATNQLPYDKVPGTQLEPMRLNGVPFGTIICYESAYPEDARALTADGAAFIVLITNNASFGRSWLAVQHLASTQLRAVEQGRPMVHAAISGISGVVGADGQVRQTTGLYEEATIIAQLQPRTGLTPYARLGHLLEPALAAAGALLLLALARTRPLRHHPQQQDASAAGTSAAEGEAGAGQGGQ